MATSNPYLKNRETVSLSAVDRYFKITERGSTIGQEIRGGLVTFFAMAYIIVLNPLIIGTVKDGSGLLIGGGTDAGVSIPKVAAATALVAGVMTILMGVVARFPLALAAGLGLNAVVAFSIATLKDMTWPDAMGIVVLEGLIILVLVLVGLRKAVFRAVPQELKTAIGVGIGLFIAFIGLVDSGFVRIPFSPPGPAQPGPRRPPHPPPVRRVPRAPAPRPGRHTRFRPCPCRHCHSHPSRRPTCRSVRARPRQRAPRSSASGRVVRGPRRLRSPVTTHGSRSCGRGVPHDPARAQCPAPGLRLDPPVSRVAPFGDVRRAHRLHTWPHRPPPCCLC